MDQEKLTHIIQLGVNMRDAQKAYFKATSQARIKKTPDAWAMSTELLKLSKDLEKEWDELAAKALTPEWVTQIPGQV